MNSARLLEDLRRQGVHFRWTGSDVRVTGNLGRVSPDYKRAIREQKDFVTLVRWQTLQEQSEKKFGHRAARFYPFLALNWLDAPVVQTSIGPARVVQVNLNSIRVVSETETEAWLQACRDTPKDKKKPPPPLMTTLKFHEVSPPTTPPEREAL